MNLHATLDGPVDAPTLLLANSLGTTSRVWDAQFSALARHFRLVRFDHRGHGESWSPPGPWSIADLGRDVLALLDELGIERASFAGLSIGGMVGMWLAAHAPARIDRLVLVCTSAHLDAEQAWRQRATTVRSSGMAAIAEPVVARWFTPAFAARQPQLVAEFTDMLAAIPAEGYAACCDALATLDLRAELACVRAPTLVITGACDLAIPPVHGRRIADAIGDARLLMLDDAAHIAPVEQPKRLTRALLDHLLYGQMSFRSAVSRSAAHGRRGGLMDDAARHAQGMATRRAVVGDAHVDAAVANTTEFTADFQDFITRYAWGEIWSRPGLDRVTRRAVTIAMLVALRQEHELAMHLRAARDDGMADDEIRELLLQTAIYAGVPAANRAFALAQQVLAERTAPGVD